MQTSAPTRSLGPGRGVVPPSGRPPHQALSPRGGGVGAGLARQYCGRLGKIANCKQGVFTAYHSSKGSTFVDCRLYMPEKWFDDEHAELRERCGVPPELHFTTEPKLALVMVK